MSDLHWHKNPELDEHRQRAPQQHDDDPRCHVTDPVRLHEDVDEICDWPGRSQGTLATLINVDNKLTTVLGVLGNVIGNSITSSLSSSSSRLVVSTFLVVLSYTGVC